MYLRFKNTAYHCHALLPQNVEKPPTKRLQRRQRKIREPVGEESRAQEEIPVRGVPQLGARPPPLPDFRGEGGPAPLIEEVHEAPLPGAGFKVPPNPLPVVASYKNPAGWPPKQFGEARSRSPDAPPAGPPPPW